MQNLQAQVKRYLVPKDGWSIPIKTVTRYVASILMDPFGGVKQVEVGGSLKLVDKNDENNEPITRIVLSNPDEVGLVPKMKTINDVVGMDFSDQYAPKPIVSYLGLGEEEETLYVELDLFDAIDSTKFKIFSDKIKFKGQRACELLASKFSNETFKVFGNKICGEFEVEVPAPPCYELPLSK